VDDLVSVIFDGATISLSRWRSAFKDDFSLIIHRAKPLLTDCLNLG
jgi:hypothetical protein